MANPFPIVTTRCRRANGRVWRHGVICLSSQAVCASFDFGLRLPANLFLLALILGAIIGRAVRVGPVIPASTRSKAFANCSSLAVSGLLVLGLLCGWREMTWSGAVELALDRGEVRNKATTWTPQQIDQSLQSLTTALPHRPDDAEGHLRLAELLVLNYRQAAQRQIEQEVGPEIAPKALEEFTSLSVLHARACEFSLDQDSDRLAQLRSQPSVHDFLLPALQHAVLARDYGPLLPAHQLLAQLCFLVDDPLSDAPHITRMVMLRPRSPEYQYSAGALHWQSGRIAAACQNWQRCLTLSAIRSRDLPGGVVPLSPAEIVNNLSPCTRRLGSLCSSGAARRGMD